jgi:hypothetical protein
MQTPKLFSSFIVSTVIVAASASLLHCGTADEEATSASAATSASGAGGMGSGQGGSNAPAWDYGEEGPHAVAELTFDNPGWPAAGGTALPVHIYLPDRVDPAPTLFFSHGFGATDPTVYEALINHLVSHGFAVVYSIYPTTLSGPTFTTGQGTRYNTLWAGFEEAVLVHGAKLDLTRVGFLGHSFGAGATPAMAYRGLVTKGWGSAGAFMFIMAPWYSFEIADTNTAFSDDALAGFPDHVRSIIQVYDEDDTNDHLMAIDLFENMVLPAGQSVYHNLPPNQDYSTGHNAPTSGGPNGGELNELDTLGIWRPLDALIDASFDIYDPAGGAALAQTVGPLPPYLVITTSPTPVQAEDFYRFPWSGISNLRD